MQMCDRLRVFVLTRQEYGEIVVRVYSSGLETKRFLKLLDGAVHITNLRECSPQVNARGNTVGLSSNGFAKLSHCVCITLCLEGDFAARKIHALACYQIPQAIHERICHAHAD